MKSLIPLIFILFYFSSCRENKIVENYNLALSVYDNKLTNHFPILSLSALISYDSHYNIDAGQENYNGFHLITKSNKNDVIDIEKSAIKIIPFIDSCQNFINYNDSLYKDFGIYNCNDTLNIIPIPNFSFCSNRFSKDFFENITLYILDAKPGKFLEKEYLTPNGVGLPHKWKHGYSKGLALNEEENIAIYWLEIW